MCTAVQWSSILAAVHLVPSDNAERLRDPDGVCDALAAQSAVDVDALADRFAVLADRSRLRILVSLLQSGELCVADLSVAAGLSVSATSHALAQLQQCAMVAARREGRYTYYEAVETPENKQLQELIARPTGAHRHRHRPAGKVARAQQP
jgi:DNA-binding transcriptional ArsR family regulator